MARTTDRPRLRVPSPDDVATEVEGLVRDQIRRLSMALDSGASTPTDADYSGFPVEFSSSLTGKFTKVPYVETELPAAWLAGTCGINFASLTYAGEDLLAKYSVEIEEERAIFY